MLTQFDKALVPILASVVAWINQKYGFHIDASPETLATVVGFLSSIIVYFVPNKVAS